MAFSDEQQQALKAKLRYRHVRTRAGNGNRINYVEGWHVIAEANRIFGYDCWDRQTLSPRCLWRDLQRGETTCFYTAKVRITVRAGDSMIVREGIGTGTGRSSAAETAHEIALKAAETDATKRALATFGNPFGLALYDKEQRGITRPHGGQVHAGPADANPPVPLPSAPGFELRYSDTRVERFSLEAFVAATLEVVRTKTTVQAIYAFWELNFEAFASLPRSVETGQRDPIRVIGAALKERVHNLMRSEKAKEEHQVAYPRAVAQFNEVKGNGSGKAGRANNEHQHETDNGALNEEVAGAGTAVPGQLAFPKEKRIRDKGHLAFVAGEPCLVCGRRPAQAHHIRFAQPRALGLKVSDEFTVPLCNGHHDSLHNTGDERAWWARHGILDPVQIANRLWAASRRQNGNDGVHEAADGTNQNRAAVPGPTAHPRLEPPW